MNDEPLVPVRTTDRLLVEPIWEEPIDAIEGPLYQAYIWEHPEYVDVLLRESVHVRLLAAAESIPERYRLILRAGHRPLQVQLSLLESIKASYMSEHHSANTETALVFARTYVSDPEIKVPPHCAGAAVDVDMFDTSANQLVDFGCPMNTDDEIAWLDTDKITTKQQANRQLLLDAMLAAGFASLESEWWHFSYGDQVWADSYDMPKVLYAVVLA